MHVLLDDPSLTGIVCDFDGTLSPIVDRPELAEPVQGAERAMSALAAEFGVAAVISGRPLADLRSRFAPPGVLLMGSYGKETTDSAASCDPALVAAAQEATRTMPGVLVERKLEGVALHYRLAPGHESEVRAVAAELATRFGLVVLPGRLVAELAPRGPGKGEAVASLVSERRLRSVLYAGDDVADLEAFRVIRGLPVRGVCVAVWSDSEAPPELAEAADVVVPGPAELVALLDALARAVGG